MLNPCARSFDSAIHCFNTLSIAPHCSGTCFSSLLQRDREQLGHECMLGGGGGWYTNLYTYTCKDTYTKKCTMHQYIPVFCAVTYHHSAVALHSRDDIVQIESVMSRKGYTFLNPSQRTRYVHPIRRTGSLIRHNILMPLLLLIKCTLGLIVM